MRTEMHKTANEHGYCLYLFDDNNNPAWAWENDVETYLADYVWDECHFATLADVVGFFFEEINYFFDYYSEKELAEFEKEKDCNYLTYTNNNYDVWMEIARLSANVWWQFYRKNN